MIGKKKLKAGLACPLDFLRVRMNLHSFGNFGRTGRKQPALTLKLHDAEKAGTKWVQLFVVAKCRNGVEVLFLADLKDA